MKIKISPVFSIIVIFILFACGGGGGGSESAPPVIIETTSVEFVYMAPTARDPDPNCTEIVGQTHIHPSWQGYTEVFLTPFPPTEFRITLDDVPVGNDNRIRISDGNECGVNPTGAQVENVFANGVLLTNVVDTPGNGTEPGLSFSVTADGTVTP